ncbi:MAG: DUF4111 domain-containing protein, partial [Rhodothermia bacterium]|nr:DUF4111 domain-containing protein [Rhodothermia bacterium]
VLTLCRILYTAVTGKLASKPAAAKWASHGLLAQFSDLIRLALDSNHVKNPDRFYLNLLRDMIAVVEEHLSELSKP